MAVTSAPPRVAIVGAELMGRWSAHAVQRLCAQVRVVVEPNRTVGATLESRHPGCRAWTDTTVPLEVAAAHQLQRRTVDQFPFQEGVCRAQRERARHGLSRRRGRRATEQVAEEVPVHPFSLAERGTAHLDRSRRLRRREPDQAGTPGRGGLSGTARAH